MRLDIFGVRGATINMIGEIGSIRRAEPSGEYPCTSWKYWDEEEDAVHAEEHEDHSAGSGTEGRVFEVPDVEHGLVDAQFPKRERYEHDQGEAERTERRRAQPAA